MTQYFLVRFAFRMMISFMMGAYFANDESSFMIMCGYKTPQGANKFGDG